MENFLSLKSLASSLVFAALGMLTFGLAFFAFDKLMPGDFWKEILEDQNPALANIVGAFLIGIAIIIGFAIHG